MSCSPDGFKFESHLILPPVLPLRLEGKRSMFSQQLNNPTNEVTNESVIRARGGHINTPIRFLTFRLFLLLHPSQRYIYQLSPRHHQTQSPSNHLSQTSFHQNPPRNPPQTPYPRPALNPRCADSFGPIPAATQPGSARCRGVHATKPWLRFRTR